MRALVLSGGGSRGAFQAGAIYGLAKAGHQWDLVAGVSVGALNGALIAQYPPEQHLEAATRLRDMWLGLEGNKSIYKNWILGPIMGLWKGGIYNTAPLRKLVYANLRPEAYKTSGVKLRMGAVSFETGDYRYITEETQNLGEWIMASSAFPCAFPPVKIDGQTWMDGGVRDVTPLKDVIDELKANGEQPPNAPVDVVLTNTINGQLGLIDSKKANNVINVGLRALDVMGNEVYRGDILNVSGVAFDGSSPNFVMPSPLDFSPDLIRKMIAEGERAVQEQLKTAS